MRHTLTQNNNLLLPWLLVGFIRSTWYHANVFVYKTDLMYRSNVMHGYETKPLLTIQATNMNWFRLSLFAFRLGICRFAVWPNSQHGQTLHAKRVLCTYVRMYIHRNALTATQTHIHPSVHPSTFISFTRVS